MGKRTGRPPKPEKRYIFKTIRFPPDLWRELEEAVPQGERSAVVQEGLRRELMRRQRATKQESSALSAISGDGEPAASIEIERDPERCGGHPTLAGTRMTVHDIVADVQLCGGDVRRMVADFPHLTVETVEAVLAWYGDHREEIDRILRSRREDYQRLLAEQRSSR
jgi:uncharacterized protein (DUF433 family)